MAGLLFGTAGIPHSTKLRSTASGIERAAELGLGCMEIEFVQGVKMSETAAYQVAETATRTGIKLSAHAPYRAALDNMHLHVSGIAYGKKGEINHLNLKESDLQYIELLQALRDCGAQGLVICESPSLEEDALLLKETYNNLLKTR